MRTQAIEGMATCDPKNAEARIAAYSPTAQEIAYLRFLVKKLDGKMDRYVKPEWRAKFSAG